MNIVGITKDGWTVFDRYNSHLHPGVQRILPTALGRINSMGRQFLVEEVVFDHVIGETVCVPTGSGDQIVYAKRPKRYGLTRFVVGKPAQPCQTVVAILKRREENDGYVLITAFIGSKPEPEPWDRNATEKSVKFWNSHALVWGSEPIIPGTETEVCPW